MNTRTLPLRNEAEIDNLFRLLVYLAFLSYGITDL